jgi:hypothetical protein
MVSRKDITVLFNPDEAVKRNLTEMELSVRLLRHGYLNAFPRTGVLGFGVESHKYLTTLQSALFIGDAIQIADGTF